MRSTSLKRLNPLCIHKPVNITSSNVDSIYCSRPCLDFGPIGVNCKSLPKNGLEIIYKKLKNRSYIIQPRYMLNSGSMCVTELYSNPLKIRLIHELLFKEQMEKKISDKKKVSSNSIFNEKIKDLLSNSKQNNNQCKKKNKTKNGSLLKYEIRHLCNHENTDTAGTLLKVPSEAKNLLKVSPYFRMKEHMKVIMRKYETPKARLPDKSNNISRNITLYNSATAKHPFFEKKIKGKFNNRMRNYEKSIRATQTSLK